MAIGDKIKDVQRNGYYNVWQISEIEKDRVYCQLVANDMHKTVKNGETANFTKFTVLEWEKV